MEDALSKRLNELALRAAHTGRPQFTRFLEPACETGARAAANRAGAKVAFFGGYDGAERRVAAFYGDTPPEDGDWPLRPLRLEWNAKFASPATGTCWAR